MTEFGRQYLEIWLRGRILLSALGVLVVLAVTLTLPTLPLLALAVILGLNLIYSAGLQIQSPRLRLSLFHAAFLIDILGVAVIVRYTNGVAGGFAAAYILIAFNSILLLGRAAFVRVAGVILVAFLVQVALELLGFGAYPIRLPTWLPLPGHALLLGTLLYTSYLVSQTNSTVLARWRGEKQIAETGRATAEQEQQRWALINKVALRVQESTTPQQVLQSVGEELERVGLHCVVFEWAKPDECLQISHVSMDRALSHPVFETPGFEAADFRLYPAIHPELQEAIAKRTPILIREVEQAAELYLPRIPRPVLRTALRQLDAGMMLYAPMTNQNHVSGVLLAWGETLNENDLAPLAALAQQTASALDKARLLTLQNKRAAQLELAGSISTQISTAIQTDEIIHSLVRAIGERFGYPVVSIVVVDHARNDLFVPATYTTIGEMDDAPMYQPLDRGILGHVARTGKTYLARETRGDPYYYSPHPTGDPIRSELVIPLRAQDRVIGALDIESAQPDAFDSSDVTALTLLADQISAALEKSRLFESEARRAAQLDTIRVLALRLTAERNLDVLLHSIVSSAVELVRAQGAALYIADDAHGDLVVRIAYHLPQNFAGRRIRPGEGLAGRVAQQGEPMIVANYATWEHRIGQYDGEAFARVLGVPLKWQERVLGVINLHREADRPMFEQEELHLANLFAAQAAIAMENARLVGALQTRVAELDLLFEGFRATASTLEPDQVISRLLEQLVRGLDITSAYFVRARPAGDYWEQTHEYFAPAAQSYERTSAVRVWETHARDPLMQALAQGVQVAQQADPSLAEPLRAYMRANQVHTILRVPLRAVSELIGYLSLWETRAPRAWTADEIRFVQTMASQAAAALTNAQLYQAAQTRSLELHALYEASRLLNASLDVKTICETSVDALCNLLGYHHVSIYFVRNDMLELQVQRGYDSPLRVLQLDRGIIGRAARTREVVFLPDVDREPGYIAALPNVQSEIALPLRVGERMMGVLNVEILHGEATGAGRPGLTEADVQLLRTFANQLAVAMENARLFQETQQRLVQVRTLHAAAQAVNADLQLGAVLEQVVDQFITALNVDSCTISEFDATRQQIVTLLDRDPLPEAHAPAGTRFGMSPTELELMRHSGGKPHAFRRDDPNLNADLRQLLAHFQWRAVLIAPLIVKGEILGYVELGERKAERTFDGGEMQLAGSLANQAAIAIQNARLYEQTKRDAEVKAALLRELSHRVKNNLAAITSLLYMALDEPPGTREQILNETLGRVQSMALAHALLARSEQARVNLLELGRQVLHDTVRHLAKPGLAVDTAFDGEDVQVAVRQTTTLALVLNELGTNALRHGLNGTDTVHLRLRFNVSRQGQEVCLALNDDGRGFPHAFELSSDAGLGLNLVRTLVEKDLHGRFVLERRGQWTCADIRFRLEEDVV